MEVVPGVQLDRIPSFVKGRNTAEMEMRILLEPLRQDAREADGQLRMGVELWVGEETYPAISVLEANGHILKMRIMRLIHGSS